MDIGEDDMVEVVEQEEEEEGFEEIEKPAEGLSEHNGSYRKWYKGFRR